ncbi:N6-adenosine-specific RNA methylase IME4 [Rhizobium petrolearium]|uniref:MT-A70 family methyltransferase n=1 Tax=Neorhizobium petrolearium TaxID=515361 RepID=UPI001AE9D3F9|nr:MT-A70 family methyltransferase [Neorhizobium petrolearium]MBP1845908.1 N6-adenosine-specific RNA methylase IME4 [Neorhizobium petrolearium]
MTWFFDPLLPLYYERIVIDPPWGVDLYSKEGARKSALGKYDLMKDADIMALPVGRLASMDCLLYCWATAPQLPLAIDCVKAWASSTSLFWSGERPHRPERSAWVRATASALLARLLSSRPSETQSRQAIPQAIFNGIAREHSRKPVEFYDICDRVMPHARRADVFARESRAGWHSFGNEVTKFDEVVA